MYVVFLVLPCSNDTWLYDSYIIPLDIYGARNYFDFQSFSNYFNQSLPILLPTEKKQQTIKKKKNYDKN